MNNKSKLLALGAFAFSAIAAVGCNQNNGTFTVTFTGNNCTATSDIHQGPSSKFTYTGKSGEEIKLTLNPDVGYTFIDSSFVDFTVDGKTDTGYTCNAEDANRILTFNLKGNTEVTVTASKAQPRATAGVCENVNVTFDKDVYEYNDTVFVTLQTGVGYVLPDTVEEAKKLIEVVENSGAKYDISNYQIKDDENRVATFDFVILRNSVVVNAKAIAEEYSLVDTSYGCTLDLPETTVKVGEKVKVYFTVKPGFEYPANKNYITIRSFDHDNPEFDSFHPEVLDSDEGGHYFIFTMPAGDAEVCATAISTPVNIEIFKDEGVDLILPPGPFRRGDRPAIEVYAHEGYTLEGIEDNIELYYFTASGHNRVDIDFDFDHIHDLLEFNVPGEDEEDVPERLNIYLGVQAPYLYYDVDVSEWAANPNMEFVKVSGEDDPEFEGHHINEEITIEFAVKDGYKVPFSVHDFTFQGIDPCDVTYERETGGKFGTLKFVMPANDVAINGDPIVIDYDITARVVDAESTETIRGSADVSGLPEVGQTITVTFEAELGYKFSEDITAYEITTDAEHPVINKQLVYIRQDLVQLVFTMPASDVTILAPVTKISYEVDAFIDHATCEGEASYSAYHTIGDTVTFTFEADEGYSLPELSQIAFNGISPRKVGYALNDAKTEATVTFTMPANPVSLTGFATANNYKVTVNATNCSRYIVSGTVDQHHINETVTVDIYSDLGYVFDDTEDTKLAVNTETAAVTFDTDYVDDHHVILTFTMPSADVKVTAEPHADTFAVKTNIVHGSISPDVTSGVFGKTVAFVIQPDVGYDAPLSIADIDIAGNPENVNYDTDLHQLSFTMPANEVTVSATCTPHVYNVTTSISNGEGVVTSTTAYGDTVVVSIHSEEGYVVPNSADAFAISGGTNKTYERLSNSSGILKFTMPHEDVTVSASCTAIDYIVDAYFTHGTATVAPTPIHVNTNVTVTVTPDEGYTVPSKDAMTFVGIDRSQVTASEPAEGTGVVTLTFRMPANNVVIHANCVEKVLTVEANVLNQAEESVGYSQIIGTQETGANMVVKLFVSDDKYVLPNSIDGMIVVPAGKTVPTCNYVRNTNLTEATIYFVMPGYDVTFNIVCDEVASNTVTIVTAENGKAVLKTTKAPVEGVYTFPVGSIVEGKLEPDSGYQGTSITSNYASLDLHYTRGDETFWFVVPAIEGGVGIKLTPTFELAPESDPHVVTIDKREGGTITNVLPEDYENPGVKAGVTVTGTLTPNSGFKCTEVTVTKTGDTSTVPCYVDGTMFRFVMPNYAVTVTPNWVWVSTEHNIATPTVVDEEGAAITAATIDIATKAIEGTIVKGTLKAVEGQSIEGWTLQKAVVTSASGDITCYAFPTGNFYFEMPAEDVTSIVVTLEPTPVPTALTLAVPSNGSVTLTDSQGIEHTVTPSSGEGITINELPRTVLLGRISDIDEGYKCTGVAFNGSGTGTDSQIYYEGGEYFIVVVGTKTGTITATFNNEYNLSKIDEEGGTLSIQDVDGNVITKQNYGEDVYIVATPETGFKCTEVRANGQLIPFDTESGKYKFTMPAGDVVITAKFEVLHHITVDSTTGGTATVDKEYASAGETVTITTTPESQKIVKSITTTPACIITKVADNSYTFEVPLRDVAITVEFADAYTVQIPMLPAGQSLSLDKTTTYSGDTVTITTSSTTPGEICKSVVVRDVTTSNANPDFNATPIGGGKFVFEMPSYNVKLVPTFGPESPEHNLSYNEAESTGASELKFLSSAESEEEITTAAEGSTVYISIKQDLGFLVPQTAAEIEDSIKVSYGSGSFCSVSFVSAEGIKGIYSFTMPAGDVSVKVNLPDDPTYHNITVSPSTGGHIEFGLTKGKEGTQYSPTLVPDTDMKCTKVLVNNVELPGFVPGSLAFTFTMPGEDVELSATFEAIVKENVTVGGLTDCSCNVNGSVKGTGDVIACEVGSQVTVTFTTVGDVVAPEEYYIDYDIVRAENQHYEGKGTGVATLTFTMPDEAFTLPDMTFVTPEP